MPVPISVTLSNNAGLNKSSLLYNRDAVSIIMAKMEMACQQDNNSQIQDTQHKPFDTAFWSDEGSSLELMKDFGTAYWK
jgi:hypothetical protein